MYLLKKIYRRAKRAFEILFFPFSILRLLIEKSSQIENSGRSAYQQLNFSFSPIYYKDIINYIKQNISGPSDLIVVPPVYCKKVSKLFKFNKVISPSNLECIDIDSILNVIWCTARVDKECRFIQKCYRKGKKVFPMSNVGPAKPWMHDHNHEKVLSLEFQKQKDEGFAKFAHGIGADFSNILQCIDYATRLEGCFVEIGCFRGSSSCVMANYINQLDINKKFYVYDYFDGFTYDEARLSPDHVWLNTHKTEGRDVIEKRILSRGIKQNQLYVFQRNIIEKNSLREIDKICFANLDVDIYEAVLEGLFRIHEKLVKGGIILVEDKGHSPKLLGAFVALTEFFDKIGFEKYFSLQLESGQQLLLKISD